MVCRRVGGVPALWQRLVSQPTNQTVAIGALSGLSVHLELAERLSIRQPLADAVAGLCPGGHGELGNGVVLLPLSERTTVPWRQPECVEKPGDSPKTEVSAFGVAVQVEENADQHADTEEGGNQRSLEVLARKIKVECDD